MSDLTLMYHAHGAWSYKGPKVRTSWRLLGWCHHWETNAQAPVTSEVPSEQQVRLRPATSPTNPHMQGAQVLSAPRTSLLHDLIQTEVLSGVDHAGLVSVPLLGSYEGHEANLPVRCGPVPGCSGR